MTRDRVQAAALSLFAARGFEGTGIRQIAAQAGISVASLYHYMGTKEDLLERLMRSSMQRLLEPAAEFMKSVSDPVERLARLVDLHVREHARENLLCIIGDAELRSLSPERRRGIVTLRDAYQKTWEATIAEGCGAGRFKVPDVKLAAYALIEMCTGVAYWYTPRGRLGLDQISTSFTAMALSLVSGADPGGPAPTGKPRAAARAESGAARRA